jgi:phospholipid/cholesterol/gamma-HCH transport system substrate-binding protein
MPRTRSLAWSELKVGVLTIFAVAIAMVTVFMLTGGKGFPWQRYELKVRFPNIAGLNPGSPVRLAGVDVGSVTDVAFAGEQVDVSFEVNRSFIPRITSESIATLGSVSLLGESAVDITPSTKGTPVPEHGYVKTGPAAMQISDLTNQAGTGITQLTALIEDIRGGRGTVGKLMTDEALYAQMNRLVTSLGDLTDGIQHGHGTIGQLLNDPKTANELNDTLANIQQLTARINAGEGSIGKLLSDDTLARNLSSTTARLDALVAKLNTTDGTAGKLINDPALFNKLTSVADRMDALVSQLNAGEGTAGQLLKDKQLYDNMNKVVTELQGLVSDIRKDPKKYINVRVSIF